MCKVRNIACLSSVLYCILIIVKFTNFSIEREGDQHEKAYNSSNVSFADGAEHVTSDACQHKGGGHNHI